MGEHMKFIKIIVAVLSIILAVSYGLVLVHTLKSVDIYQLSIKYFAIGFIAFFLIWMQWMRIHQFYSTFEHEFTHLIVGLLFLKKPAGFQATERQGGYTVLYGSNFVITLAPYFLPTFVFLLLPLYLVLNVQFVKYFFILFGLLTSYHFLSTWQEFSYRQPDIIKSGKVFSTIFLIFTNILCYGIIITFVLGGFEQTGEYIVGGIIKIKELYFIICDLI